MSDKENYFDEFTIKLEDYKIEKIYTQKVWGKLRDMGISKEMLTPLSIFRDSKHTILETTDELAKSTHGSTSIELNTYPFGVPTNKIYPQFLAICNGGRRLSTVLEKIKKQCEMMITVYPNTNIKKQVLLITDKWHPTPFSKYEVELLNFYLRGDFRFIFVLINDYGVTRIPFTEDNYSSNSKYKVIQGESYDDDLKYLIGEDIEYRVDFGTWLPMAYKRYKIFINKNNSYYIEESYNKKHKMPISQIKAKEFARDIQFIKYFKEPDSRNLRNKFDAGYRSLKIFGKEYRWCENSHEDYNKIDEIFYKLLK